MKFLEFDHLPDTLLERPASALHQVLKHPSLIYLEGRRKSPLVVGVLQHGNEDTGWEAVRRLLKSHYQFDQLPRSLLVFVGNVRAARRQVRRLDDQPDFNRCWPSSFAMDSGTHEMFQELKDGILAYEPWACVDIHNNTGLNPHYAALNLVRPEYLRFASCFSTKVVYYTRPGGTMSQAFSDHCPSLTLECGQAGNIHGVDHTMGFLETVLHIDEFSSLPPSQDRVQLYHMAATVKIPDDVLFGFGAVPADLSLREDLDSLNFQDLPRHTVLGRVMNGSAFPLHASDTRGRDVTRHFFSITDNELHTTQSIMPSMLTLDRRVIQQDCLCYLMERLDYEHAIEPMQIDPLPDGIPRVTNPGGPGGS